jgi:hypothetical protein
MYVAKNILCFLGTKGDAAMPLCFVIMGFGEKTDFATGRKLDLDKTYLNIIKPAATAAGYDCIRADEVLHSGVIDVPMYKMLFTADLVIADLSTSNPNALFELGVRHALKPKSTIVIAESQFRSPFDVNHIVIRRYVHLGVDIGFTEALKVQHELRDLALAVKQTAATDSPVYIMLPGLKEPSLGATASPDASQITASAIDDKGTYAALWDMALNAKNQGDFALAKTILRKIYDEQTTSVDGQPKPARPRVIHELTLAIYKSGEAAAKIGGPAIAEAGYKEAAELLQQLGPDTTTDPETLGLWSAIHKRRAELPDRSLSERRADLDIAILAAERGFLIRSDYYTGTNAAYLLNVRASLSDGNDKITDNVLAARIRRKVVEICNARLAELEGQTLNEQAEAAVTLEQEKYWTKATLAESLVALGQDNSSSILAEALQSAPAAWMADATRRQVKALMGLLPKN